VWVGAIDSRVKCLVSVVGVGNGARCVRSVRALEGESELVARWRSRVVDNSYGPGESEAIPTPERKVADLIRI
jgi:hypothetical protein